MSGRGRPNISMFGMTFRGRGWAGAGDGAGAGAGSLGRTMTYAHPDPHPAAQPAAHPHPSHASLLASPIALGPLQLRSRVVMASMHTGLEDRASDLPRLAAFYRERAAGGVGLIVTGGVSPTREGRLTPGGAVFANEEDAAAHRVVTEAVHAEGGLILLQLLHAGRYAAHRDAVAPSSRRAPISPITPREMSDDEVTATVSAFARAAALAREVGYDGVEIMGSEGYLLNQFLAPCTNGRSGPWGGSPEARRAFPLAVARACREALDDDALLAFRISILDLVEDGQTWEEVLALAEGLGEAGVGLLTSGIGWHESRIPTILSRVPQAAWREASAALSRAVNIPVAATNRIPSPALAEEILAEGEAAVVALARPLLADSQFVAKAAEGRAEEIMTCIACNQACLDLVFSGRTASCMVNPRAGRETEAPFVTLGQPRAIPARQPQPAQGEREAPNARGRLAVVGGGPAGLAAATAAAERGFAVTLFEAAAELGGQFRLAARIPGKEDYAATPRDFAQRLADLGAEIRLNHPPTVAELARFDQIVVATGVAPRVWDLPGAEADPRVITYAQAIENPERVGERVAIIGGGGIGVDVAHLLAGEADETLTQWQLRWGVAPMEDVIAGRAARGGLALDGPVLVPPTREVTILQRSAGHVGARLGRTSAWAHRAALTLAGVRVLSGVTYLGPDDDGLHLSLPGEGDAEVRTSLVVETVVVCAGQEPDRGIADDLLQAGIPHGRIHVVGGASEARELDAVRAIEEATRLVAGL